MRRRGSWAGPVALGAASVLAPAGALAATRTAVAARDYRRAIVSIVQQRMATDGSLRLIDGLALVPNQPKYFVDGVHPNDAGFALYASNLEAKLTP
jgi:hypothetical protein